MHECCTPTRQEGLVLHECSEIGMNVNINKLTVFTAVIKFTAFADDFVEQSAKQF